MNFRSALIDIALIRTDGGTQVREALDQEYVTELLALWEDNRQRDLPPIIVYRDEAGEHWLADGFHRHAAALRAESDSILAEVRHGSVDEARLYAAGANTRNGMRLNPGDKKRAILLADKSARSTGKPLGVRELARLVGCVPSHVVKVLGGEVFTSEHQRVLDEDEARVAAHAALYLRVDGALREDPAKPNGVLARELACSVDVVRRRREALGLAAMSAGAGSRFRNRETESKIVQALKEDPSRTNASIAKELKTAPTTVQRLRVETGLPPKAPGGRAPSAPVNPNREDPRDKAEVIQIRPVVSRPSPKVADLLRRFSELTPSEKDEFTETFLEGIALGQHRGQTG